MFQVSGTPRVTGVLSWFEEGKVWMVAANFDHTLKALMSRLQVEAASLGAVGRVREGDLVAARYSLDTTWYRARVLKLSAGKAEVEYVDFGNYGTVTISSLKSLPGELRLHPGFAMAVEVDRNEARVLSKAEIRELVGKCLTVTAELVQPKENKVVLYLGGEKVCPPPAVVPTGLAPARLTPEETVVGLITSMEHSAVLVQGIKAAARVTQALDTCLEEEGIEAQDGDLVLELGPCPRRLVVAGNSRALAPDSQLEVALNSSANHYPCPSTLARLPSAAMALISQSDISSHYPLQSRLVLLTTSGVHIRILHPRLYTTTTTTVTQCETVSSPPSKTGCIFDPNSPFLVTLSRSTVSWDSSRLCEIRDRFVQVGLNISCLKGGIVRFGAPEITHLMDESEESSLPEINEGNLEILSALTEDLEEVVTSQAKTDDTDGILSVEVHSALPPVKLDTKTGQVTVCNVKSSGRLLVEVADNLAKVQDALGSYKDSSMLEEKVWQVGDLCVYTERETVYRAVVLVTGGRDVVEVLLVDQALVKLCHPQELGSLSGQCVSLPPAVLEMQWRGCEMPRVGQVFTGGLSLGLEGGVTLGQ